jgi:predicted kinase
MDVVYLYGPPAVGKWTVAGELAARTGYRVFHNHLSIDCVRPIFEFGTEPFWRQVHAIREGIMAEAARAGRDLVFTTVFARDESEPQTLRRFAAVERNGGRVCLVKLTCSREVLEQRVVARHRVEMNKIASVAQLRSSVDEHDVFASIPYRDSLVLDTSRLQVAETVERIIDHYRLPVIHEDGTIREA